MDFCERTVIKEKLSIPFRNSFLDAMLFLPNSNEEKFPVICKSHGLIASSFEKEEEFASILNANGLAYFVFHYTGFKNSMGTPSIETSLSNLDTIISFLINHPKIDPLNIGLYGVSLGGALAICHCSRDPRISAIALQAPLYDFSFMINYPGFNALKEGLFLGGFVKIPEKGIKDKLILDVRGNNPLNCIGKISPRPILIIAGGKDNFIPIEGIEKLYKNANEPKEMIVITKADHNLTEYLVRIDVFNMIKNFFIKYLEQDFLNIAKIPNDISAH